MRGVLEHVARRAPATVLVRLERGMPASSISRAIHDASAAASGAFVELACGSTSLPLLREGLTALAHGTLLLDDVARLGDDAQAWLAGALSTRCCNGRALGANVCATLYDDPERLVGQGRLREDLLYRLNTRFVRPAPLRERAATIVELARALAQRFAGEGTPPRFSERALVALRSHAWPGNDRELELVLERAVLIAGGGPIDVAHLGLASARGETESEALPLGRRTLREVEEALIRRVLCEQGGNKSRAAAVLGLHRATLHEKLASYELDRS